MTGADNSTPLIPLAAFRGIIRRGAEGGLPTGRRTVGLKKRRVRWSVRRAVRSLWKPCGVRTRFPGAASKEGSNSGGFLSVDWLGWDGRRCNTQGIRGEE